MAAGREVEEYLAPARDVSAARLENAYDIQ